MTDDVAPEVFEWIADFADALGVPAPDAATAEEILDLAGVAARGSARQAAPIACWLAAAAGRTPAQALDAARALGPGSQ